MSPRQRFLFRLVHGTAIRLEKIFDTLRPWRVRNADPIIEPYLGYAARDRLIVRGRVLTSLRRAEPDPGQSRLTNLRQMLGLFLTNEVAGVTVETQGGRTQTDEEGYFTLELANEDPPTGWTRLALALEGHDVAPVTAEILGHSPHASYAIVSDIDDTILETGAYSIIRNLWTTLTGNALTRNIFPDSVSLLKDLCDGGRNPIFYVSSSPWNLYAFLRGLFDKHEVPRGPIFLRDFGVSETKLIKGTHGDHKGPVIEQLMADLPNLRFILIGDTGQHDADIYCDLANRFEGRVAAILLREARSRRSAKRDGPFSVDAGRNIPVFVGPTFRDVGDLPVGQ